MENRKIRKSVKRQRKRSSAATYLSNPDLTTAEKSRSNSGFPPGITVDELFHYRRKKPPAFVQLHDNLKPEDGSFRTIKSEYNRRYRRDLCDQNLDDIRGKPKKPEDSLKVEGPLELNPEYYESFIEHPIEKSIVRRPKNLINGIGMEIEDDEEKKDGDEEEDQQPAESYPHFPLGRHYLFKRPTNLKLEGDFYAETENAQKFIEYLLTGRPDLARTPTTLKMEGEMETKTETRDKYVPFEYQSRPPLYKKNTNLHLEGILDITTESREKFLPYEVAQRAPLTKRGTNLHLEGDLKLQPEYRDVFVEHKVVERSRPRYPINNLKTEGIIDTQTEKAEKFVEHQIHPVIPFLRGTDPSKKLMLGDDQVIKRPEYREKFVEHPKVERFVPLKPRESLKPEGDMETFTENKTQFVEKPVSRTETRRAPNNLLLEGNIDMNPEYRNAYVNFYRDAYGKFGLKKEENEQERRRRTTATNLKSEGKMETNPEYKSAFVDFPRHRPSVKRPEGHLHSEGKLSHITEKRAQFVEHPKASKVHPMERRTELKLEGPFECQPEYRRAYIDYITRENIERQSRPLDHLGAQPKRVFDDGNPAVEIVPVAPVPPVAVAVEEEAKSENTNEAATPSGGEGNTALPAAKSKLPLPTVPHTKSSGRSRTSSVSPASRTSGRRVNKENVTKMENCLFGPKVPNPSGRLRHTSPTSTKRISDSERQRIARARRRYGSPVMVENLAYTPRTSPVQAILEATNRGRWKRSNENSEDQAFMVLGSLKEEYNNNDGFKECPKSRHRGYNELLKEQKWMPSWYAPPSK